MFNSSRLLSCTQDFCLFVEDYLKKTIGKRNISRWMADNGKLFVTLNDLIKIRFPSVSLYKCGAESMHDLDSKLSNEIMQTNQPQKCLRILTLLRNYSSHNIEGGKSTNVFYNNFLEIMVEIIRAIYEINPRPYLLLLR